MPFQNRVTPFGDIVRSAQRGTFIGNRGVLHNAQKEIVRTHALKAWITCRLDYKNVRREIMAPSRWTELFFWDEATAFAAGHRPCAFCRHPNFKQFKTLWLQANKKAFSVSDESMKNIDTVLHAERIALKRGEKSVSEQIQNLPDGSMVRLNNAPSDAYLLWQNNLYLWRETGYINSKISSFQTTVYLITPPSIVATFRAGYVPTVNL